jgi:ribosome recycling factor
MNPVVLKCEEDMKKKLLGLDKDLSRVRTGRASVSLLDGVKVDYYGTLTPLSQVASLSTPDARQIVISPFEKKSLSDIERAIQIAQIGIQPTNDGHVIRLPIPPLNEERRKEIAKSVKKFGEEAKVGIRKIRQDWNTQVKKMEKDKELGEDESKKLQKEIQDKTDDYIKKIDEKAAAKEKEILSF